MNAQPRNPPSLDLFQRVGDYAAQLGKSGLSTKSPLKQNAPIILFCQLFFQQFFDYEFGFALESVDQDTKQAVVALRIEHEDAAKPEAVALMRSFEDLCDMWPDVLGFAY